MPLRSPEDSGEVLRWLGLSGVMAVLMSLLGDVVHERGGSTATRIARAVLNALFALGVGVVLLRWFRLSVPELLILAGGLGSLGQEVSIELLARLMGRADPRRRKGDRPR